MIRASRINAQENLLCPKVFSNHFTEVYVTQINQKLVGILKLKCTRWFKYDRDWFVCKQAALRSSCATL